MKKRAAIEADLQYHLEERAKAAAAIKATEYLSKEYKEAQFQRTWHSAAASALALVLGIEGDLDAIARKGGKPE